jgi:2,4-dienoyl-CoA reductase-like NADH-dependent reductase (Old Yellow Enzyme family)
MLFEVIAAVRSRWPERYPLFVRISATDYLDGGWDLDQSVELCRALSSRGVDLVDCSSGGIAPGVRIEMGPGYQTSFAERIRREAGIRTGAVGMITSPAQAEHVLRSGQADLLILGRAMLRNPYWALGAATKLGASGDWPKQYLLARPQAPRDGAPPRL